MFNKERDISRSPQAGDYHFILWRNAIYSFRTVLGSIFEYRKSLVTKAPVCQGYDPPRSKLLLDCGNRLSPEG